MDRRPDLNALLQSVCSNVYFQPPKNVQMVYPAIVYERARGDTKFANNNPYNTTRQYDLTLISQNPDEPIHELILGLPMCTHERFFVADNLNHDVFTIYF